MNYKAIKLITDISFFNNSVIKLNFPLRNSIRLSFWFPDIKGSSISEIEIINQNIEQGFKHQLLVKVGFNDLYQLNDFIPNRIFFLGTFPHSVAEGVIIDVIK